MATAPAGRPQEVKRREMQEVKAPEQFQFTKPGQVVSGVLLGIEPISVKGKEAIEYTFMTENGSRFTCLGTADLNKKIMGSHVGHYMDIRYENDNTEFQKPGQSPMRMFKVSVSKEPEPGFSKVL